MSVKESLLKILEESGENELSGQELADRIGVSRTAIWKAMKNLSEDGFEIEGVSKRGYRLIKHGDSLSEESIRAQLTENLKKNKIILLKSVNSTNTLAKKLAADGEENGTIIIAEEQTAGRGRRGNSFFSPMKTGLYMSIILRSEAFPLDTDMFTICAGCAVCKAIEGLSDKKPRIKWVNDIFLNGKKICGILSEATTDIESGNIDSIVIGIGINLTTRNFPDDITETAGALGESTPRGRMAARIINELYGCLNKSREENILYYKSRSLVLGKEVNFFTNGSVRQGKAVDIDPSGQLVVLTENGTEKLNSGEISIRF